MENTTWAIKLFEHPRRWNLVNSTLHFLVPYEGLIDKSDAHYPVSKIRCLRVVNMIVPCISSGARPALPMGVVPKAMLGFL
jgi:hypothetical protein